MAISVWLELGLIIICTVFLILILAKYSKGKSKLKLLVFWIFFFIVLSLFFVFLSRITWDRYGVQYMDPQSIVGWFMFRIGYYRFAFIWISVSCYFSYSLKANVFDSEKKVGQHAFIIILGILVSAFSVITPSSFNDAFYWDLASFGLTFIYVCIVYLEFIIKSFSLYKHIDKSDKTYRNAIRSLVIMGLCFILTMLFYVADRVWSIFTLTSYSVFYYLADVAILIGIIFAYFGYVKPKA